MSLHGLNQCTANPRVCSFTKTKFLQFEINLRKGGVVVCTIFYPRGMDSNRIKGMGFPFSSFPLPYHIPTNLVCSMRYGFLIQKMLVRNKAIKSPRETWFCKRTDSWFCSTLFLTSIGHSSGYTKTAS